MEKSEFMAQVYTKTTQKFVEIVVNMAGVIGMELYSRMEYIINLVMVRVCTMGRVYDIKPPYHILVL